MKKLLLSTLFLGIMLGVNAQKKFSLHFTIDALSGGVISGIQEDKWDIRQTFSSYSYHDRDYLTSNSFLYYLSLKPEFRFSEKLSVYTGLRYTEMGSDYSNINNRSGFFYVRSAQSEVGETNLYRIKSIEELNRFLSVPIEIKYTPLHWRRFRFYGKLGSDFGLLINSKRSAEFFQSEMQKYEADVLNTVPFSPNKFLATVYGAIGLGYEFNNRMTVNMDLPMSKNVLTKNHSSIFQTNSITGVQLSLSIPLSKIVTE